MKVIIRLHIMLVLFLGCKFTFAQRTLFDLPTEILDVELNRSFLIPGEELEIAITCKIPGHTFDISKIVYIEIIDEERHPAIQEKVALIEGKGVAVIYFPSYLKSGSYTVLVYTNWIKNFGHKGYIKRKINFVNPFIKIPDKLLEENKDTDSLHIKLFPDGGKFIKDERQLIGFKIENRNGDAVPAKVKIMDMDSNLVLATNQAVTSGFFDFKFDSENRFLATLVDEQNRTHSSTIVISPIQKVAKIHNDNAYFEIQEIDLSQSSRLEIWHNSSCIENTGIAAHQYKWWKNELPKGLLTIRIINQLGETIFSKAIFNEPLKRQLNLKLDKQIYIPREEISITLFSDSPIETSLVIRKLELLSSTDNKVTNHFLGPNDQNITSEWPQNDMNEKALLFLNDHVDISNGHSDVKYLPDFRGELISGVLRDAQNHVIPDYDFYATAMGSTSRIYSVSTDSLGVFRFSIDPSNIVDQMIFSGIKDYSITINPTFLQQYNFINVSELRIDLSQLKDELIEKSKQVQIMNLYDENVADKAERGSVFSSDRSVTYNLDDYTRFPTMSDHIVEIITNVEIRKVNSKRELFIRNIENRNEGYNNTLVTLNGIVCSTEEILDFDPLKIQMVKTYPVQFHLGTILYTGAVSFITYPDVYLGNRLFGHTVIVPHSGIMKMNGKNQTINHELNIPDMRTQLAWEPHLSVDSDVKKLTYYASDIPGIYEIIVSGVSQDTYIFERVKFEVSSR